MERVAEAAGPFEEMPARDDQADAEADEDAAGGTEKAVGTPAEQNGGPDHGGEIESEADGSHVRARGLGDELQPSAGLGSGLRGGRVAEDFWYFGRGPVPDRAAARLLLGLGLGFWLGAIGLLVLFRH